MSETPIHAEDGSPLREEAKTERPFNHPMSAYDNREVDNDGDGAAESQHEDPRMAAIERAAEAADRDRMIEPGTRQEDMPMGEPVPQEEGLQSREPIEEQEAPVEAADKDVGPTLDDFILQDEDGNVFFQLVVDGEERLIPADRAKAQLQKHESADHRMQLASQIHKGLEEREAAIAAKEQQFAATPAQAEALAQTLVEQHPGLTDEELAEKAKDVVNGLFTGTEDEAAAKMVELLKEVRGASQATPQINSEELVQQATAAAVQQLSEQERAKDVRTGYIKFQQDYPDIDGDPMLLNMADGMTDAIAQEHPDWMPSQVMQEAGKRVRKWVETVSGKKPAVETPEQSEAPQDDRQNRKRKLRPMPLTRQGVEEIEPQEQPETPQSMMDEIRASRGQAV